MKEIIGRIVGACLVLFVLSSMGIYGGDDFQDRGPKGSIYYTEARGGSPSLALFKDRVVMNTKSRTIEIKLRDVKEARRNITRFRISSTDGAWIEFSFLSLLEAKNFEKVLDEYL